MATIFQKDHKDSCSFIIFVMNVNQTRSDCSIPFLDCRGYYDLAAEIVGLILTGLILYWSLSNYRELKREKNQFNDTEYQHSLRRKIRVNLLNIIFLFIFLIHIIFSMILFQITNEQSPAEILKNQLEKWYKTSQVFLVELLNILLLSVAWLYWKGLYFFFKIKAIDAPIPFRNISKYVISVAAVYCLCSFGVGISLICLQADNHQFTQNLLVLISSIISMLLFLFFRLSYYTNIFRSIKMSSKVIRRERVYNILVVFSSLSRMTLCIFGMAGLDLDRLRVYSNQCDDTSSIHGILLLSITLVVDLLPSYVFARIFTTFERQRHLHADIEQTLFSLQPSEMVSGLSSKE